jgi:hypothetical protein
MATKQPKAPTYLTLYRLNRSFDIALEQIRELARLGFLNRPMLRTFENFTQELQADVNQHILSELEPIEDRDWFHFGKFRNKLEKEATKVPR